MSDFASGDYGFNWTTSTPDVDADGFTRTMYVYSRGPGDAPGNQWIWMCDQCDQVKPATHAPDCPKLRGRA